MQTRTRNVFDHIHTEGALLPANLLQRILAGDKTLPGLDAESYHLLPGENLREVVTSAWKRMNLAWDQFKVARSKLPPGDPGTRVTRERWLLPLFEALGYGRLRASAGAIEIEGKTYPISHPQGNLPIHLVGCNVDLDTRSAGVAGAARSSPHSLVQELLNRHPDMLWGFVSNGLRLRILRDNASLTRQAYLEFDLEGMFEGQGYSDFLLLWLLCHASRCEADTPAEFWLEKWSQAAQEQGVRALDELRKGVEEAIRILGSGFLAHPANTKLKLRLQSGELDRQEYYRQLLRLVYRLIFLFTAEDRDLLLDPEADPAAKQAYWDYYSTTRLRRLARRQRGSRHGDLWQGLKVVTDLLGGKLPAKSEWRIENGEPLAARRSPLGLPVLGGFLFSPKAIPDLEDAQLENGALLEAVRRLAFTVENRTRRVVDYKNLGPEELGSVYESLLELHPTINTEAATFDLQVVAGSERKSTGSYYTPGSLIQVLLDSALDPVIEQAVHEAKEELNRQATKNAKDFLGKDQDFASLASSRLLNLKVCDPACGSGHFLIAAAHRIAHRLARLRSGEEEPAPLALRHALREVIARCIYGVDLNPMAVELCKVNLWLEALEPGKPLSFLDGHIKCGNSLVGVGPKMDLDALVIPDEAFNPVTGDDKAAASAIKKRNKAEREGQLTLELHAVREDALENYAERLRQVEAMPEDSAEQVRLKEQAYQALQADYRFQRRKLQADLWTAAFFWTLKTDPHSHTLIAPTQGELRSVLLGRPYSIGLAEEARRLAEENRFFHWPLEFADVFEVRGGFDCVLGNPPWELLQLEEQEYFAARDPEIAALPGELRKKAIANLVKTNPRLAINFYESKHHADAQNKFLKFSGRFLLTATGKLNTYALFTEHSRNSISGNGRLGIVVPTGIATDNATKDFFGDISHKGALVSLFDFENRGELFPGIHRNYKVCLLTLSGRPVAIADFVFFAVSFSQLKDPQMRFQLNPKEISLFSPNTRTMPIFRTRTDYELTRKIYEKVPVLNNEAIGKNPWGVHFSQGLFNMTSDSGLFLDVQIDDSLPLYEAKMIEQFDHRWATIKDGEIVDTSLDEKRDPHFSIKPRYWITSDNVHNQVSPDWKRKWFIVFRGITRAVDRRTVWLSVIPFVGIGNSAFVLYTNENIQKIACLIGCLNSFVFDFVARQKIGGINLNFFIVNQIPALPPSAYSTDDIAFISPRVLELVYTAYDLKPFAEDMGYQGEPFRWDEERRAMLRAELDAYYARLYGLTRDELRYILDPQDVYGPDFPGETFRVLKEKEIRQYGEYRTRRLVLEAWDRLFPDAPVESDIIRPPKPQLRRKPSYMSEYALEGKSLGEGGQAEVFPATQRKTGQRVALKRLSSVGRNIPHAVSRMEYEIQVQALVQHPNVMPLIDYGEDFTWYTMPLASQVLSERKPPIDPDELLEILQAVGRGLAAAHAQGYIHRDIKPSNILYVDLPTEGPRWVISDWGLVHRQGLTTDGALTRVEAGFGTLGYAPPEFWEDPHAAGVPADVYSLGRVIAWALTGKNPVPNKPLLPDQPGWRELVQAMTREDPSQRLQSMAAVLEKLDGLRSGAGGMSARVESGEAREEESGQAAEVVQEKTSPSKRKELAQDDPPPLMSDFGLYKCEACGKMVMGFDRESHIHKAHKGKKVEWKRMR